MGLSDIISGLLFGDDADEMDDDTGEGAAGDGDGSPTGEDGSPDGRSDDSISTAGEGSEAIVYECRECGTTVSADTDVCPSCGSLAIAEYPVG